MKRLKEDDYTVGWICALPVPELQASRLLFDERHEDVPLGRSATNQYAYGQINGHNVVMGCLPDSQMGIGPAASVASEMRSLFPALRFGLLVGIGGGVPSSKQDVRLGDVVVSYSKERHGGVVQHDFGKALSGGTFQHTRSLPAPPDILLSGVGKLRSAEPNDSKFAEYLGSYRAWRKYLPQFSGDVPVDLLFQPNYIHPPNEDTCVLCDEAQLVERLNRPPNQVLFGTIASGNQVIKDAEKRDTINEELGNNVLCFEMEAAGVMNSIPCLVIRGICDYCDSHKNKSWQPLAAAAAAAWAKELLRNIQAAEVRREPVIEDTSYRESPKGLISPNLHERDKLFVGREDSMQWLHDRLFDPAGESFSRVGIHGLGGVGKSQIAIEYCWRAHQADEKLSIFWVHASSPERFRNDFQFIATQVELRGFDDPKKDHLKLVTTWLNSQKSGKWLLVIDNADKREFTEDWAATLPKTAPLSLRTHLPTKRGCALVVTSRDRRAAFDLVGDEHRLFRVEALLEDEAVQLFKSKIRREVCDYVQVCRLVQQLDCIPLAITQAASYIQARERATISSYLELLQREHPYDQEQILSESENDLRRDPEENVPHSVIRTWEVTFRQIRKQNQVAAEILFKTAFIDKQSIPVWLFKTMRCSKRELEEAVETLFRFSFLRQCPRDPKNVELHRLVQVSTVAWIRARDELVWWSYEALAMIQACYPNNGFKSWRACQLLEPHAQSVAQAASKYWRDVNKGSPAPAPWSPLPSPAAHRLMAGPRFGRLLRGRLQYDRAVFAAQNSRYKTAVELAEFARADLDAALGYDHSDTLNAGSLLAACHLDAGQSEAAIKICQDVVEKQREVDGAESPNTLATMSHLALAYKDTYPDEAEKILLDVKKIQETAPEGHTDDYLMTLNHLALVYDRQDRLSEKAMLEEEVFVILQRIRGIQHPETLNVLQNYATTFKRLKRWPEALFLLKQLLNRRKQLLGRRHPQTLISMSLLASAHRRMGTMVHREDPEHPDKLQEFVISNQDKLGTHHIEVAKCKAELGLSYHYQRRLQEALFLEQGALDTYREHYQQDDEQVKNITNCIYNLARLHKDMDNVASAIALLQECIYLMTRIVGAQHSKTKAAHWLLAIYKLDEDWGETIGQHRVGPKLWQDTASNHYDGDEAPVPDPFDFVKYIERPGRAISLPEGNPVAADTNQFEEAPVPDPFEFVDTSEEVSEDTLPGLTDGANTSQESDEAPVPEPFYFMHTEDSE